MKSATESFPTLNYDRVEKYARDLPHWRQDGVIYFVTYRLADSIPRRVMEGWDEERANWLAGHGIALGMSEGEREKRYAAISTAKRSAFEREQARKLFVELDQCHGTCVLRDSEASAIVLNSLKFHDGTRLRCGDLVVMPNHVHWLLMPVDGFELEDILYSVKRWSARRINQLKSRRGKLWQRESFDHIVRSPEEYERIRKYIQNNPRQARLRNSEFAYLRSDL